MARLSPPRDAAAACSSSTASRHASNIAAPPPSASSAGGPGVAAATTCSSTPAGQGRSFPPRASRPQCLHPSGLGPLRHVPNRVIHGQGK
eukprot:3600053-Pleurochrysis_carterae.AAC.1